MQAYDKIFFNVTEKCQTAYLSILFYVIPNSLF